MTRPDARRRTVWLFLIPALAFYLSFVVLPIMQSFAVSLFRWPTHAPSPERFVGLASPKLDPAERLLQRRGKWKGVGLDEQGLSIRG